MKAELVTETITYIICPYCREGRSRIDHLFIHLPMRAGPWHCDTCQGQYTVEIDRELRVDVTPADDGKKWVKTWDLLVIPPQDKPVYFIVEGGYHAPNDQPDHGMTYFYGEHTCPTNWLERTEAVISEGDADPHGLGEFVRSVDQSGEDRDWAMIFPEAFEGTTIDGEVTPPLLEERK